MPHNVQRERQREQYRTRLSNNDYEDDPLSAYDEFVQWTRRNYDENDPDSGLLELLEEATRKFKDDANYKMDLRYLKLWSLYAGQVEEPAIIYAFLVANNIGTNYSVLYEEYADVLERDGRFAEAEEVYLIGIKRNPRALGRLKSRFDDFKSRAPLLSDRSAPRNKSAAPKSSKHSQGDILRQNPLKNHGHKPGLSVSAVDSKISSDSRYALMLAPPVPGKRPEKLCFDLSLLFTEEGKEYCAQEARARSMGLLGKKWGPPPPEPSHAKKPSASSLTRLQQSSFKVDQNRTNTRKKAAMIGEPTVTINTKEALADVFGMYNSPDKTTRIPDAPGSKHAPLKKVDPITPVVRHPQATNNTAKTPTPAAFRPYVDPDDRKENSTPGVPKFKPFVDPELQNATPFTAPENRRVLSVKDPGTLTRPTKETASENAKPFTTPKASFEGNNSIARQVFTPVFAKPPLRQILEDKPSIATKQQDSLSPPVQKNSHILSNTNAPSVFTPFGDTVFSRPPAQNENVSSGSHALSSGLRVGPASSKSLVTENRAPLRSSVPVEPDVQESEEEGEASDDQRIEDYLPPLSQTEESEFEVEEPHQAVPLSGRFGQFNVMTPITERTFEFTTSTRGSAYNTPRYSSSSDGKPVGHQAEHAALENAERLAAELREEGLDHEYAQPQDSFDEYDSSFTSGDEDASSQDNANGYSNEANEDPMQYIEGKTGNLSLIDAMTLSSKFKPPNPCNPFDPPVVLTLLNLLPSDAEYHDLKDREAKLFDGLQRFAKRTRKSTGDGNTTGTLPPSMQITLGPRRFSILQKLGEGGFGIVFQAQDLSSTADEDNDEDDEDEDGPPMVAIKVVKPRHIWEYHVLRRLRSSLPPHLRRSVICPHALYAFRDESFLILELCAQGTLLDVVNNAGAAGVSQQGACLDELLVMFFTIELLRLLEGIHAAGFIHGDLKIDNCLLRLEDVPGGASAWSSLYQPSGEGGWHHKGLKVIDFGRTVDTRLFPPNQKFIAQWAVDDRDCPEVRENRPWTFQPDYYGLAGIIYCMLFGKYIQSSSISSATGQRIKIGTPFKRYWQSDLWDRLFDLLLNPCLVRPNAHLPLCEEMSLIREEMETWLQNNCNRSSNTLKGLLKKIEVSVWRGSTR